MPLFKLLWGLATVTELPMLPIPWGPRGEAPLKISAFYGLERRFFREGVPQ